MSTRATLVFGGLGLALAITACAAPSEAPAPISGAEHEALRDSSTDEAVDADEPAAPPAPAAEAQKREEPRSLADIEGELAAKEAQLRALGVAVGGVADDEAPSERGDAGRKPGAGKKAKDRDKRPSKGGGAASKPPAAQPSQPAPRDELDGAVAPDEAKATGPVAGGGLGPAERCAAICGLSQGTCELRGAICELADRHDEEDDYRSACERAAEDCEVAEEACRVCSE